MVVEVFCEWGEYDRALAMSPPHMIPSIIYRKSGFKAALAEVDKMTDPRAAKLYLGKRALKTDIHAAELVQDQIQDPELEERLMIRRLKRKTARLDQIPTGGNQKLLEAYLSGGRTVEELEAFNDRFSSLVVGMFVRAFFKIPLDELREFGHIWLQHLRDRRLEMRDKTKLFEMAEVAVSPDVKREIILEIARQYSAQVAIDRVRLLSLEADVRSKIYAALASHCTPEQLDQIVPEIETAHLRPVIKLCIDRGRFPAALSYLQDRDFTDEGPMKYLDAILIGKAKAEKARRDFNPVKRGMKRAAPLDEPDVAEDDIPG
jgi:hypothetical protein